LQAGYIVRSYTSLLKISLVIGHLSFRFIVKANILF
jgi:hypothetical protein